MSGGPIIEGNEDVISQDETKYLWGVEQKNRVWICIRFNCNCNKWRRTCSSN